MPDRVVRFTESFFVDLDSQLPDVRLSEGLPSRTDFLLHDLPRIRDRLSRDFEGNTLSAVGYEPVRILFDMFEYPRSATGAPDQTRPDRRGRTDLRR